MFLKFYLKANDFIKDVGLFSTFESRAQTRLLHDSMKGYILAIST